MIAHLASCTQRHRRQNTCGLRQGSYRRPRRTSSSAPRFANTMWELGRRLEGQQYVHHLLAVARLLHVRDLAAAAIGDASLRDLGGIDGVVALDVLWTDDAGDHELADLEIDAD